MRGWGCAGGDVRAEAGRPGRDRGGPGPRRAGGRDRGGLAGGTEAGRVEGLRRAGERDRGGPGGGRGGEGAGGAMRLLRKETLRLEIEFGAMLRGQMRRGPGGGDARVGMRGPRRGCAGGRSTGFPVATNLYWISSS